MSGPTIDLGDVMRASDADQLWAIRGKAVQSYANLEQSLCSIFQYCSGTSPDVAGIIFFRITSSQVQSAILEKLIRKKFGSEYNLFWNSLIKLLRPIDIKRNEIVHWNVANIINISDSGVTQLVVALTPPNIWDRSDETPHLTAQDLADFAVKCDFFARLCNMFRAIQVVPQLSEDQKATWQNVFLQPVIYPPQPDHPLCQAATVPISPDVGR